MTQRRLHPTLADYVAIAINPVLVMGLVGSLIYFLLELLYQGAYPDRLQFCLTMFIIAIVFVSRIAMEEGYERAAPFGVALAVVVALALDQFIAYGHGTLAHFGWLINWCLMALTWWCAHQLTWDSTVLDDGEAGESQGLLETVGIDKATGQPLAEPPAADPPPETSGRRRGVLAGWEQALNRKGKPHAPGVWVVYFSLASLPIFGIGQRFIPAGNKASRRYVFALLSVYVACGLGLLLTTSFLALRRYLRRRRLEMPSIMAGTWLASGAVLIVALLLFVALLPRPNPEYAISAVPLGSSSPERSASTMSVGSEGTRDSQSGPGSGQDHSAEPADAGNSQTNPPAQSGGQSGQQPGSAATGGQSAGTGQQQGKAEPSSGGGGQGESKPAGSGQAGNSQSAQQGQAGGDQSKASSSGSSQAGSSQSGSSQSTAGKTNGSQNSSNSKSPQSAGSKQPPASNSGNSSAQPTPQSSGSQPASGAAGQPQPKPAPPPAPAPAAAMPLASLVGGFLAILLKWIFYGVVLAAMIYFGWQYREQLMAMLRDALNQIRELWAALFGGGKKKAFVLAAPPGAVLEEKHYLRFADFLDPFARGSAGQYPPAELVKYTFAALEAWGRDHELPRAPDVTPHEFVRGLGAQFTPLAADARLLADQYCRAVYSSSPLPTENLGQVRRLWITLHSIDAQLAASVGQP